MSQRDFPKICRILKPYQNKHKTKCYSFPQDKRENAEKVKHINHIKSRNNKMIKNENKIIHIKNMNTKSRCHQRYY